MKLFLNELNRYDKLSFVLVTRTWFDGIPKQPLKGTNLTRISRAVINVDITGYASPAWSACALACKQPVNADAVHTGITGTQIYFLMTTFACESRWAGTSEVCYQVSAVCSQEARSLSAVV